MSAKELLLRLIFRADAKEAKAATKEVKAGIAEVSAETKATTAATDKDTAATVKNAEAKTQAAEAARQQAEAERQAREAAAQAPAAAPQTPTGMSEAQKSALRAQYVPAAAARQQYDQQRAGILSAGQAGALTTDETAAAMARLQMRYDQTVEAIHRSDAALAGNARNMKLSAFEARNLSYQVNDVFQSVMLGMPMQQVLMQQGPQIVQIYGGVGNTFRALRSVLTPTRLLLGSVSVAAIAGASAWSDYLRSTQEVETAADGLGRGLARSSAELEAAAQAGAAAAGISIKAARSMEVQFLRTGRIGAEHYEELIALSKDFAATIGIDASAAGGALAEMFADPAKAADTLFGKYGLIDAATARYVRNLTEQNRVSEAQGMLLDRLPEKLSNAETHMHALDRAIQGIKRTAAGLWDGVGKGIDNLVDGPTLDELVSQTENQLARMTDKPKNRQNTDAIARVRAERDRLLNEQLARDVQAALDTSEKEAMNRGRNALVIADGSGATSQMRQEQALSNQVKALQQGQNAPGLDAFQQQEITQTLEAKSRALDALITRQERLTKLDQLDAQISAEKNPLLRAELEERRTRLQMAEEEVSASEIESTAARARNRVIEQTITSTRTQATELTAEAEIRARLTAQVAAGQVRSADVNRLLQEELTLRPLVAAAAAAEGDEKRRLTGVIDALREAYRLQAETQADSRAQDYLQSEQEKLDKLRLEVALLGQSEAARARVLAQYEAELKIRELGATGNMADRIRAEALANADHTRILERQVDAWKKVQDAAEAAIDGSIDALAKGNIKGALAEIAQEAGDMMLQIGIKNPVKNALLGTDLPTLSDVGGIGGIWDRLTGKAGTMQSATTTAAMAVSAQVVTINAGSIAGLGAGAMSFAQTGGAAAIGGLGGSADVQQQVWDFFARKNLKPHQIAAIMGNVAVESSFDPLNVGDYGKAHGLFQWNDRAPKLFDFIGGQGNLGNVQAQLEFAWQELLTSENGPLKRLMAAPDLYSATHAFTGFERPSGYDAANPSSAAGWQQRLAAAEAAMAKFGATTEIATSDLGTFGAGADRLGTGLQGFGSSLASMIQGIGAGKGIGGAAAGSLLTSLGGLIGLPGFATGGQTPDDMIAVSAGEYYIPAAIAQSNLAALTAINTGRQLPAGMITGPGTGTSDSIMMPARAGDYIVNAAATARNRPLLDAMVGGKARSRFATGGQVASRSSIPMPAVAAAAAASSASFAQSTPTSERRVTFEINVSGTGDRQIQEGVTRAINAAFDAYTREALTEQVRTIMSDRWMS